jgi:cobyrinic acid a,c-diamide synthase
MGAAYKTPRILVSGVASRVGKSIFTLGLALALRKRKLSVSVVSLVPNIGQSLLYYRLTRRYSRVIDANILSLNQIKFALDQASVGADIVLVDGNAGLFDYRYSNNSLQSDAKFAEWTKTPVLMVVDGFNMEESIGPLVRGYWACATEFAFAGVVINRVSNGAAGQGNGRTRREVFEKTLKLDELDCYLGSFPVLNCDVNLPQHFISSTNNVSSLPRSFFVEAATSVENMVDIDKVLAIAETAQPIAFDSQKDRIGRRCRIAVPDDSCFGLTLQDNLELLRYYGAEIVPFSPLADTDIPERIGAIYLAGSYLQSYPSDLANNIPLKAAIKAFVKGGGILYAEGNSSAYLCENFSVPGKGVFEGVGILPAIANACAANFCYADFRLTGDTILGDEASSVKGINPREWEVIPHPGVGNRMSVANRDGEFLSDGLVVASNVLAVFGWPHFGSNPQMAKSLVDFASMQSGAL